MTTAIAVALLFIVPNINKNDSTTPDLGNNSETGTKSQKRLSLWAVAKSPALFFPYIDNFICFCGNGMVESMLEPHLKNSEAMASQFQVSMTFLLLGGSYMLTAPSAGWVSPEIKVKCREVKSCYFFPFTF